SIARPRSRRSTTLLRPRSTLFPYTTLFRSVRIIPCKDGHRTACLLEGKPEEDGEKDQYTNHDQSVTHNLGRRFFRFFFVGYRTRVDLLLAEFRFFRIFTQLSENFAAKIKLKHTEKHKDTGQTKSIVPSDFLADITTKHHSQESTRVNTHVKNGISRVLAIAVIRVKLPYNG